jgi:hypothetical protein
MMKTAMGAMAVRQCLDNDCTVAAWGQAGRHGPTVRQHSLGGSAVVTGVSVIYLDLYFDKVKTAVTLEA